ncbi:hypothetical protein B0H10DRAFT_770581 [Mycena sp. CBHHK59/15]|nr:hypothetical protein B0H10DRAFT_770581 [Mycena sp. CBHHK59/15]
MDIIAASGYTSDTGERDNPTCSNFEKNQPVRKIIDVALGYESVTLTIFCAVLMMIEIMNHWFFIRHHTRLLNRKGRAICRIVHSHGWSTPRIALIFGISQNPITRALANNYSPPDDVLADYQHVDAEFDVKFPPKTPQISRKAPVTVIDIDDSSDDESKPDVHSEAAVPGADQTNDARGSAIGRPMVSLFIVCPLFMGRCKPRDTPSGSSLRV